MFVRVCPYFPFSARVCLNQHHWLANHLRGEGIGFQQRANAFVKCAQPRRLQELADGLAARDLLSCGEKWLARFTPFFSDWERRRAGCQHRWFVSQIEYCDNLIFHRRAALDGLGQRLLDANRTIGQPNKITTIFGRRITKRYRGQLQTVIEDLHLPNPVIRSHYGNGFIKQYVRDHVLLRTEAATNNVTDYGIPKAVDHLPQLRSKLSCIVDTYLDVQQDILDTFVDRGQLRALSQPTVLPTGQRVPGLKLDHPRLLAVMHALVAFSHIAVGSTFTTADLYPRTVAALSVAPEQYRLSSLRYDLSKLRAKGLVEKLPHSRRYKLRPEGYRICLVFLKLFDRIYAPLTAGLETAA
jgi:DNA-binding transcriptional ArsR family regulator